MFEFLQYAFFIRAAEAGLIIGIIAPLIGIFLVVRRFSLLSDTLSHVTLAGVALSFLLGTNVILTALVAALAAAFGIEKLRARKLLFSESILALFLSGSLAISAVLFGLAKGFNASVFNALFGSLVTVTESDLVTILILGLIIIISVVLFYKELVMVSFDEQLAEASGISVRAFNAFLIIMAAVTVSLTMRIVGVLLVGALMVIPVLTAMNYRRGFKQTLVIALVVSLVSVAVGLLISFYAGLPTGGTIILINLGLFIISMIP
ncbi:MAG: metal ABC transporter permease [Candidatus Magasanikbacteria bacterium]|nr:metal ABC transporter permease [Candidatus Magasanikbacteria bacterium]